MAIGRPWRAIVGWLSRLIGRERQTWVEPGNAITRAVLSGAELSLPELPGISWRAWEDAELSAPITDSTSNAPPVPDHDVPAVPATGDEDPGSGGRRWRAA